jgi:hypothetical protein
MAQESAAAGFAAPALVQSLQQQLQLPHSHQTVLHVPLLLLAPHLGLLQLHVCCTHQHGLLLQAEQQPPVQCSAPYPTSLAALPQRLLKLQQRQGNQR